MDFMTATFRYDIICTPIDALRELNDMLAPLCIVRHVFMQVSNTDVYFFTGIWACDYAYNVYSGCVHIFVGKYTLLNTLRRVVEMLKHKFLLCV